MMYLKKIFLFVIVVAACLLITKSYKSQNLKLDLDINSNTNLPIIGCIFYPDQLPDGNYSVAKAALHGETIIVHHLPGPDRNFVYYVMNCFVTNVPDNCIRGSRFTIFRGLVV